MSRLSDKKQKMLQELGKEAIFEAVVELFGEKGFDAVTMSNVAERAGMATGTLYNYFKSKEEILHYVHTKAFGDFFDSAVEITANNDVDDKLEAFLKYCFGYFLENMGTFIIVEKARIDKKLDSSEIIALDGKVLGLLEEIIQKGINDGIYGVVDVNAGAKFIFCIIIGISKMEMTRENLNPESDSKLAMSFIRPYLMQGKSR